MEKAINDWSKKEGAVSDPDVVKMTPRIFIMEILTDRSRFVVKYIELLSSGFGEKRKESRRRRFSFVAGQS